MDNDVQYLSIAAYELVAVQEETKPELYRNRPDQTKIAELRIAQAKMRGRPPKFKADMVHDAQQLGALGFTEEELALYWGVSPRTILRWKKRGTQEAEELCLAIERGKLLAEASVSRKLFDEANKGDMTAIKYYLNNRAKSRWRADTGVEINQMQGLSIQNAGQITFKDKLARQLVDSWTPEAKQDFIKAMQENAGSLGLKLPRVRTGEAASARKEAEEEDFTQGQEGPGQENNQEIEEAQVVPDQAETTTPVPEPAAEAILIPERKNPEGSTATPEPEARPEEPAAPRSRSHAAEEVQASAAG